MGDWFTKRGIYLEPRVGHAHIIAHLKALIFKGKVNLKPIFQLLFFDPRYLTWYGIDSFKT